MQKITRKDWMILKQFCVIFLAWKVVEHEPALGKQLLYVL